MGVLQARTTGKGMHVDVAMLDCVLNTQDVPFLSPMNLGKEVQRFGNRLAYVTPFDTFKTKDGWLMIATANNNNFGASPSHGTRGPDGRPEIRRQLPALRARG